MRESVILVTAQVHAANALSGYVIGLPSLPAVWGHVHTTELTLNEKLDHSLSIVDFSVAYKNFSMLGRAKLSQNETRYADAVKDGNFNAPIIERPKSNFHVSVAMTVFHADEVTPEAITDSLMKFCNGSRFAGGMMEILSVEAFDSHEEAIYAVDDNSFFICDYNAGKEGETPFGELPPEEKIKLIEDLTSVRLRYEHRTENSDTNWYITLVNGYKGITQPKVKHFSRQGLPHMFAEPTISIYRARLARSVKSIMSKTDIEQLGVIFEQGHSDDSFFITAL